MNRDNSVDAAAGLMIIYMIYGHIGLWCGVKHIELLQHMLYFFMPWFFFKSGMFFKQRKIKDIITNGYKRLIIPYIIFSVIGQMIFSIMYLLNGTTSLTHYIMAPLRTLLHEGAVVGNSPLWFLLTLFIVQILFGTLCKYGNKSIYLGTALSVFISFALNVINFYDFFYISNSCLGLFFFGYGYIMKDKQYTYHYLIAGVLLYIVYSALCPVGLDFRSNSISTNYYLLCMVSCLGGIITINNLFKRCPKKMSITFAYIGRNSMTYYVLHWIILGISSIFFRNIFNMSDGYLLFSAYILANIILLPLADIALNKRFKWILGK